MRYKETDNYRFVKKENVRKMMRKGFKHISSLPNGKTVKMNKLGALYLD